MVWPLSLKFLIFLRKKPKKVVDLVAFLGYTGLA